MIQMNDFVALTTSMGGEVQAAIDRVVTSGWYILGEEVSAFEREFAAFVGAPHAIGVGNGMDAIQLALESCGVGRGDEVITTPNSAFASTLAIVRLGAVPVFVDIEAETGLLDVTKVVPTARTRALLPVHLYGQAVDVTKLPSSIALVNDAAQAHGAKLHGRDIATYGDATAYSFYPTKNLGALGDGGAVVCADPSRAAAIRRGRDYGQERRYEHTVIGMNSRLDELQAAVLRAKLRHLAAHNARRRAIAQAYSHGLRGLPIGLPGERQPSVWHQYVLRCDRRDALQVHLKGQDVQSLVHYPLPIHLQPAMKSFGHKEGELPVAEKFARECLSLPIHPLLDDAQVQQVIAAVTSFFK
jgi:dTDP-4-amino-4,6-dideoxygalactose transaminase